MNNSKLKNRVSLKRRVTKKFKTWRKRFLLAEFSGAALAVAASYFTNYFTQNRILAAYAGAAGDTIGFYAPIIIQDALTMRNDLKLLGKPFRWNAIFRLCKNMLLEFGPAELIDSAFLRPLFMFYFPILLHNYPVGIIAGKLAGDIAFYVPVTLSNRLRALGKRN